jgi:hypothetical protein
MGLHPQLLCELIEEGAHRFGSPGFDVVEGLEAALWVLLGTAVEHVVQGLGPLGRFAFWLVVELALSGTHPPSLVLRASVQQGPFARAGLCCPGRRRYYGPLRLPLGCPPLPVVRL